MNTSATEKKINPGKLIFDHFYIGVAITAFYILIAPSIIDMGYPGLSVLLMAEVFILVPLGLGHLWIARNKEKSNAGNALILYQHRIGARQFIGWTALGMAAVMLIYLPLYPVGLFFRESVFSWLPEWYFNPTFGTDNMDLIARVFLIGIFVDGIIGPVVEELYFRGYLLPRMHFLGKWAPVINGTLFGLYHFWQPHNLIASVGVGIILSYIVWKKKNVYLGIAIHCILNILGSTSGYLATLEGIIVGR